MNIRKILYNKQKSLRYMYEKGYNKGIDETCNYICREWLLDRINSCEDFDKISQQLKVGEKHCQ